MKKQSDTIRQSLAAKLGLGYLLLTIVVFVVSLGIFFIQSLYLIRKEAIERGHATLSVAAQRVVRHLTTVETATDINSWLVTENLQPDSLLAYTHRITQLNPDVDGCSITTEPDIFPQYGRYFSAYTVRKGDSITTVREAPYEYFEKVWYKTPKAKGHACWVDPFDDTTPGTLSATDMIASYCKPLYDDTGRFVAVISTDLSLPKLSKAITAAGPRSSWRPTPTLCRTRCGTCTSKTAATSIWTGPSARRAGIPCSGRCLKAWTSWTPSPRRKQTQTTNRCRT